MQKKLFFNVNVDDSRVEQFDTLQEAEEYVKKLLNKIYITKSVYEYDETTDTPFEISEFNVNQELDENLEIKKS